MKKYILLLVVLFPLFCISQNRNKEDARHFIDSLRTEVLKGTSFGTLASLYSEDPGSAKQGGQLPAFTRGQMVSEFETVAFTSKVGEVSEVFETKFGFHFLLVTGREGDKISAKHILISYK
jgi:peptidyl-prolyl cis-trans isomerase SurA